MNCFTLAPSSKTIAFCVNIRVTQLCTLEPYTLGLKGNLLQKSSLKINTKIQTLAFGLHLILSKRDWIGLIKNMQTCIFSK